VRSSRQEFENKVNKELNIRVYEVETLINKAIYLLTKENIEITSENLTKYTYLKRDKENNAEELIDNEGVRKVFGHPVPSPVWEEMISQPHLDEITGEPVLFEELEDIGASIEGQYYDEKHKKQIESMNYAERYRKGYFDQDNIFECFGFCWSNHPNKNESLIPDSYKGLLIRLHDFRYNENPPERVNDFNDEWIHNFFKFLVEKGYSKYHPKAYDPFTLHKTKIKFIKSKRQPYKFSAFEKMVKHFKRYLFLLQKYKVISYQRNPDFITAKDYVGRKVNTTSFTRTEHSLTTEEFTTLCNKNFNDDKLNLARDMFILATLGGGFRGEELYNNQLSVEKRGDNYLLHIYHSKNQSKNINPVFGELKQVIDRHSGSLPEFLPIEEFRTALKTIAHDLEFDRIIYSPYTFLDADNGNKQIKEVLKDIFSTYFARKTLVTYLNSIGMHDEDIIEFSAHSNTKTLAHYKAKLSLENKEKFLRTII
jgi:hypothetical protein